MSTDWNNIGLQGKIVEQISLPNGLTFGFPGNQNSSLAQFADINEPHCSPVIAIRAYNKSSLQKLWEKLGSYKKTIKIGAVVVAVPEGADEGHITREAFFREHDDFAQQLGGGTPVILVEHDKNTFDAPLNIVTAIILALRSDFNIDADFPLWFHSNGPTLQESEREKVKQSLQISPFIFSVRTPNEDLFLTPELYEALSPIRQSLHSLFTAKLLSQVIAKLKHMVRNTCMVWGSNALKNIGGFNPLFGGGDIKVSDLPDHLRIASEFDGVIVKAPGEEDTDAWGRACIRNPAVRKVFEGILDGDEDRFVRYFDPDVKPGTDKFFRAWGPAPHPAHHFMFPHLAETTEHKAGIALLQKIAANGHVIPEDFRGVRFV